MKKYIALFFVVCFVSGCVSERQIGGREFPLKITTTINSIPQPGATVFAVPYDRWLKSGMTLDNPKCRQYLEENWKVTDGKTPVTIYYASYRLVIIAEWNGKLVKAGDTAVTGDRPELNIEME